MSPTDYIPCPVCGYVGPGIVRAESAEKEGVSHVLVYHHADGRTCRPLCINETHTVRCSDCGRDVVFQVRASPMLERTSGLLACSCGARWRLTPPGGVERRVGVYVAASA